MKAAAAIVVAAAVFFGAWLRWHGLDIQVVQDDEWHAIHKLLTSSYLEIFSSFGYADHSIPLTMFYKEMADGIGLDEIDMRIVQVACGIALIAVAAQLAWKATRDAAATMVFAWLIAGAPFLILYSRFARPYAITTLLATLVLAGLWEWRRSRSVPLAVTLCAFASLSAWLHPLSALFPMAALLFIVVEDALAWREARAAALRSSLGLAAAAALAIAAPLAAPMLNDFGSLSAKAGATLPSGYTLFRVLSLFAGGLPDPLTALVAVVALFGAIRFYLAERALGSYLAFIALGPILAVLLLGASWTHQGHTFARYVFPVQLVFLFWFSYGALALPRLVAHGRTALAELSVVAIVVCTYVAVNPAVEQVTTLGPWYGHLYHHYDYVDADNRAKHYYDEWQVPRFYRTLGALAPGSITIIQAPFNFIAPYNPNAFYAGIHRQGELQGFVHALCMPNERYGEVRHDPRFRFRSFIHLDDRAAVLAAGARYIVFQRDLLNGKPFKESGRCVEALQKLYGEPIEIDARVAVFDVQLPGRDAAKLQ